METETKELRKARIEASLNNRYGRVKNVENAPKSAPDTGGHTKKGRGAGSKPKDIKKTILFILSYVKEEKLRISLAVICVLIYTVASLATSYMLRPIINTYIAPVDGSRGYAAGLFVALIGMGMLYLLSVITDYIQSILLMKVGQNCLSRMREDLYIHVQKLSVKFYDESKRGDILSRFTNDIDNVGNMLSSTLISLLTDILLLVGTFAMMLYTNVILTLVTVIVVPVMLIAIKKISLASSKYYSAQQRALGTLNGYIEENVSGSKVIKVFNHEDVNAEEFDLLNERLKTNQIKAQFWGGIMGPISNCSTQVSYTLTAVVGGLLAILRGFDIGGMTVFLNYSRQFNRPINDIAQTTPTIFSALAGAERVMSIMSLEPEDIDDKALLREGEIKGDIVMDKVDFSYDKKRPILKGISLYAHPGQKIAFVGSTGAGKTTVMNLLPRFYDIDKGSITIDGRDIRDYERSYLRKNIAMVLQDSHLFAGNIRENIRYGRPDATDREVEDAARLAGAHSFIKHLPMGYDTVIDAEAANLSQGQRQMLNIARASLSKAPILILDEATSSVDTRTEEVIDKAMFNLMSERTTFVIAHRLSTVRDADAIMVLENGSIIERGTEEELLSLKGRYYELYTGLKELD